MASLSILLLDDLISRNSNLFLIWVSCFLYNFALRKIVQAVSVFAKLPFLQISLVLFALGVCEVGGLSGVQRQTKAAFVGPKVVPHNVGVIGDVSCFNLQLSEPLFPNQIKIRCVGQSRCALGANSILEIHL